MIKHTEFGGAAFFTSNWKNHKAKTMQAGKDITDK
jgi:hypothetical protein